MPQGGPANRNRNRYKCKRLTPIFCILKTEFGILLRNKGFDFMLCGPVVIEDSTYLSFDFIFALLPAPYIVTRSRDMRFSISCVAFLL